MLQKKLMIGVVILIAVGAGSAVYHNLQLDPYSGSTGTTASAQTTEYAANFNGSAVTMDKDTSYALGMLTAGSIGLPPDLSFDYTALMEGFRDFNEAKETRISQEQAVEKVKDTMTKLQAQTAEPAGNSHESAGTAAVSERTEPVGNSSGNTATPASLPNPEPVANFHYDLTEDGSGIVINRYIGKNPNVVIPATIEEYPVLEIGERCFDELSFLGSVVIPEGVRRIGAYAFCETGLRTIKIPDSVEYIEEGAFRECSNLTDANISASIKEIGGFAFSDCVKLSNLAIPGSIKSIEFTYASFTARDDAFENCALTIAARRRLIELGHPDHF